MRIPLGIRAAGAFWTLSLFGCAEQPSFTMRWDVAPLVAGQADVEAALDEAPTLDSAAQCRDAGIWRVEARTTLVLEAGGDLFVETQEFACFPPEFASGGEVTGPELEPGTYRVQLRGLRRDGEPFPCAAAPEDQEPCERDFGWDEESLSCVRCTATTTIEVEVAASGEGDAPRATLLGARACNDGLDNDLDGFVDMADPACQRDPIADEQADDFANALQLRTDFFPPNDVVGCSVLQLGTQDFTRIPTIGLELDGEPLQALNCAELLDTVLVESSENVRPLRAWGALLDTDLDCESDADCPECQAQNPDGVPCCFTRGCAFPVTQAISDEVLPTDNAYARTFEFGPETLLEPLDAEFEFTMGFEHGIGTRACPGPGGPALGVTALDGARVRVFDADDQVVDTSFANLGSTPEAEGWLRLENCPTASVRSLSLPWGNYRIEAEGLAGEVVCHRLETQWLGPGLSIPMTLERVFDEQGMVPAGCEECSQSCPGGMVCVAGLCENP